MPRPITKEDIKKAFAAGIYDKRRFKIKTDDKLCIVVFDKEDRIQPWAYACYSTRDGGTYLRWVNARTFKLRQKIGHPKPRKKHIKQMLGEPEFGLEEMALAETIMNGG